jgi:hypothetical protein
MGFIPRRETDPNQSGFAAQYFVQGWPDPQGEKPSLKVPTHSLTNVQGWGLLCPILFDF